MARKRDLTATQCLAPDDVAVAGWRAAGGAEVLAVAAEDVATAADAAVAVVVAGAAVDDVPVAAVVLCSG